MDIAPISVLIGLLIRSCAGLCDSFLAGIIFTLCAMMIQELASTDAPVPAVIVVLGITSILGAICPIPLATSIVQDGVSCNFRFLRRPRRQGCIQFFLFIAYLASAILLKANYDPMDGRTWYHTQNTRRILFGSTKAQVTVHFMLSIEMLLGWLTEQAIPSSTEQAVTDRKLEVTGPGNTDSTN
jgi:hypothetical protein